MAIKRGQKLVNGLSQAVAVAALGMAGTAHAGLTLDLNGSAPGGGIVADALDWAPTSFLAKNGIAAINAFDASQGACASTNGNPCEFTVITQAKLTGYKPTGGNSFVGLPTGVGEITIVTVFNERVIGTTANSATFQTTGVGFVEFFWSAAENATDLTGFGFTDGTLIGRLSGVRNGLGLPATGSFTVTAAVDGDGNPIPLDATSNGNQFPGQFTVAGFGSEESVVFGNLGIDLDPSFFLTKLTDFRMLFENISIGLPFSSADPADCFNQLNGNAVGTSGYAGTCDNNHVLGAFSAQGGPGTIPVTGSTNGVGDGPDFVAQTDFNSPVNGTTPEPGTLALLGLALSSFGLAASRRRKQ